MIDFICLVRLLFSQKKNRCDKDRNRKRMVCLRVRAHPTKMRVTNYRYIFMPFSFIWNCFYVRDLSVASLRFHWHSHFSCSSHTFTASLSMHVLNMIRHIKILFVHFLEFFLPNFYYLLCSNNKQLIRLAQKLQVKREQISTRSIDMKAIFTWSKIKSNLVFTFTFPSVDIFFYFVQKFVFVHWSIHEEIVKTMVFTKTT